jgi:hypothetical protein
MTKPWDEESYDENPIWTKEDFKRAIPFSQLPADMQKRLLALQESARTESAEISQSNESAAKLEPQPHVGTLKKAS